MGDIVLTAGVRQNLLSLQNTAQLMSVTQNRLATGKKVNSALDNPTNFFTSQSLSTRATDLNSLLDSIGQAQKTLETASQGITSLTNLVSSAKSTVKQARQAPLPTTTYAAVNANGDFSTALNLNGDEVIGTQTGNNLSIPGNGNFAPQAIAVTSTIGAETLGANTGSVAFANDAAVNALTNTSNGTVQITLTAHNGVSKTFNVALDFTAITTKAGLTAAFNSATAVSGGGNLSDYVTASYSGNNLKLTANSSDVDFAVSAGGAGSTAQTLTDLGITAGASNSTSLLDNIGGNGSLTVNVNGTTNTLNFNNTTGIETTAQLNTALQNLAGGISASAVGTTVSLSVAAGAANTLSITASNTVIRDGLGLGAGGLGARGVGQTGGLGTAIGQLSRTYNSAATLADTDPTNLSNGGTLTISVNGTAQTVGLAGGDHLSDIISKLQANATLNNNLTFADNGSGDLKITAKTSDVDFSVTDNATSQAIGLTTGSNVTTNSTSLLDRLADVTHGIGSAAQGSTLTIAANGGVTQTITFGTNSGEISTKAELTTALTTLSGVTATLTGTSLNVQIASGTSATSLTVGGTAAAKLGLTTGTQTGAATAGTDNVVRANLQTDYNNALDAITQLAKDSTYGGINLMYGDNLKVVFNENGTSSLNINGVTFDSNGLGLTASNGSSFQDNNQLDTIISSLDGALTTLRSQASKFGSSVTTVQTRQDFTKGLINTLQTGSDNLVLADTNEEGANMLALQTRQQLSTTALSLSAQAAQAVLRLFG